MTSIGGIILVFACVVAGYLMEKGKIGVLLQPAELIIIFGAAIGTVLTANPIHILKKIAAGLVGVVKGSPFSQRRYVDTLKMMFDLLARSRKEGAIAIEADIEDPDNSPIFSKYPEFLADHHARDFVCDTMRMAITGGVSAFDVDQMMELDMDVHHHSANQPSQALTTMADALPGLGIVAAVLGVVVTMGSLGGPPEEIGSHVAAALVGTFLGILLCYGLVGPLASFMSKVVDEENSYYHVLRVLMLASIKGTPPIMAVEMGRRAIPEHTRPSFIEVEKACRERVVEPEPEAELEVAYADKTMSYDEQVIIVKKKGSHGGHHGGAWKVAYADFVTALMSLFIVLWLMNSSKPVQEAVGGYFRDPYGTAKKLGTRMGGTGDAAPPKKEDMARLKEELMKAMGKMKDFEKLKKLIEITVTPEGLQIELMEDPHGTFFEKGSAEPTPILQKVLKILAPEAGKLPNTISIEGHTDSKPYSGVRPYGNWELSTDRANTARRLMESSGLHPGQVVQVRGYADHKLRKPLQPEDACNRRITVIIQYIANPTQPVSSTVSNDGTLPKIK